MQKLVKIPKYIKQKINQQNKALDRARSLGYEIQDWAESVGCDIYGSNFSSEVKDCCSGVEAYDIDSLQEYINKEINGKEV